ncbi:adenylate kinase 9-like [Sycon ciliatum]|uniref:adenylate kinase 9-like n=1 Tax=Sycon ciliatum TaxID=27933 RepID=UPI0031F61D74
MDVTVSDTNTLAEAAGLLDDSADSKKPDKTAAVVDTGKKTREFVDGTVADLVELEALQSTPTCFLVIGKPGIGKSSLASRVAKSWGCVHVNVRNSILQAIAEESDIGKKCAELLENGEAVGPELAIEVMRHRMTLPDVAHYGYILDDIPCAGEPSLTCKQQLEIIKSLRMKPDVIINLKMKDVDIILRREGQKVDPLTGDVFIQNVHSGKPKSEDSDDEEEQEQKESGEGQDGEDEEEGDEDNEEEEQQESKDDPAAFVVTTLPPEVCERLVRRDLDEPDRIKEGMRMYKEMLLTGLEDALANHERTKLMQITSDIPEGDVFRSFTKLLAPMNVRLSYPVKRLNRSGDDGDDEDDADNLTDMEGEDPAAYDTDEMMRLLASTQPPGPGFRWKRSRWGRYCPVELSRGNLALGRIELAVSFLSRCYCLSSVEAFQEFRRNPRRFLVGDMPRNPVKIAVLGGPKTGKSTLCHELAAHYGAVVIDPQELIGPFLKTLHTKKIEAARAESLEVAIDTVRMKIMTSNTEGQDEDEKEAEADRVSGDHPDVRVIVADAVAAAEQEVPEATGEAYIELLEAEIKKLEAERKEKSPNEPYAGRWIVDGFPSQREHWLALEEVENPRSKPDLVVVLSDSSKNGIDLMNRWKKMYGVEAAPAKTDSTDASGGTATESDTASSRSGMPPEIKQLAEKRSTYDSNISSLLTLIKSSGIEPVDLEIVQPIEDAVRTITDLIEEPFKLVATEMTQQDEEEEADDASERQKAGNFAFGGDDDDDEDEDDEDEEPLGGDKNWGPAHHYCPVALQRDGVLRPGNPEYGCRYLSNVYHFMDEESQKLFLQKPEQFLPENGVAEPPPMRISIVGPKASGKTAHCRILADELGIFHIDFRALLQEYLVPKLKVPVGRNPDDIPVDEVEAEEKAAEDVIEAEFQAERKEALALEEKEAREAEEAAAEGEDGEDESLKEPKDESGDSGDQSSAAKAEQEEAKESISPSGKDDFAYQDDNFFQYVEDEGSEEPQLDEFEESIRAYLADGDAMSNDVVEKVLKQFWYHDRYRHSGFILEGFPNSSDDVRVMAEIGLLPDMVLALTVEEDMVVKRLLPGRLERFKEKLARRKKRNQDRMALRKKERQEDRERAMGRRRVQLRRGLLEQQAVDRAERAARREERGEDSDYEEEEPEDNIEEELETLLAEEFADDEEDQADEEEEEEEEDDIDEAEEKMTGTISEDLESEQDGISGVVEVLGNVVVPHAEIDANRKIPVVRYLIKKALEKYWDHRQSLLTNAIPIDPDSAFRMAKVGYKKASKFGSCCPVELMEGMLTMPFQTGPGSKKAFPVVMLEHIYYCSSQRARSLFIADPLKYLSQPPPHPTVPLKMAIVGPPKVGKTLVAQYIESKLGCVRLSMGSAIRWYMDNMKHTNLGEKLKSYLQLGSTVPMEMCIQILESVMMSESIQQKGYILDGWPLTMQHVELLKAHRICPYLIMELELGMEDSFQRARASRVPYPENDKDIRNDSSSALELKTDSYTKELLDVRNYYETKHRNWLRLNGYQSRWSVRKRCKDLAVEAIQRVQAYIARQQEGKAARIGGLCVTPEEFAEHDKCHLGLHCPVSWASGELHDGSALFSTGEAIDMTADYMGRYYCMDSEESLQRFLDDPAKYLPGEPLPPQHLRACVAPAQTGTLGNQRRLEGNGNCPVTYAEVGRKSLVSGTPGLVPGNPNIVAEYDGKFYCFADSEHRKRFLRRPTDYTKYRMPRKMPAVKQPIGIAGLPNLGYFEQSLATALSHAIAEVALVKPKYPFMRAEQSAKIFVALYMKAHNPNSSEFRRKHYQRKLERFREMCQLTEKVARLMPREYVKPEERSRELVHALKSFVQLKSSKIEDIR